MRCRPDAPLPGADGPLDERVLHKNWKIRKEAYEELGRKLEGELDPQGSIFSQFGTALPRCLLGIEL